MKAIGSFKNCQMVLKGHIWNKNDDETGTDQIHAKQTHSNAL